MRPSLLSELLFSKPNCCRKAASSEGFVPHSRHWRQSSKKLSRIRYPARKGRSQHARAPLKVFYVFIYNIIDSGAPSSGGILPSIAGEFCNARFIYSPGIFIKKPPDGFPRRAALLLCFHSTTISAGVTYAFFAYSVTVPACP